MYYGIRWADSMNDLLIAVEQEELAAIREHRRSMHLCLSHEKKSLLI